MTDIFGTSLTTGSFPIYLYPVLLLAGIGGVVGLIYFILRRRAITTLYLKDPLFDGPSRSFYGLLDVAVREHFSLFRNILVDDVIQHSGTFNPLPSKVRSGCFDLLLCDRRKMLPRCGIVLVDKQHPRKKETELLRTFCDRVGLPLLVYETGGMFDVSRLRHDVYQATGMHELLGTCGVLSDARGQGIDDEQDTDASEHNDAVETVARDDGSMVDHNPSGDQNCKKCGSVMVRRTISKGKHSGRKALVCESFPDCRYAVLTRETVS